MEKGVPQEQLYNNIVLSVRAIVNTLTLTQSSLNRPRNRPSFVLSTLSGKRSTSFQTQPFTVFGWKLGSDALIFVRSSVHRKPFGFLFRIRNAVSYIRCVTGTSLPCFFAVPISLYRGLAYVNSLLRECGRTALEVVPNPVNLPDPRCEDTERNRSNDDRADEEPDAVDDAGPEDAPDGHLPVYFLVQRLKLYYDFLPLYFCIHTGISIPHCAIVPSI